MSARESFDLVTAMLELQPRLFDLVADCGNLQTALDTIVAEVRKAVDAEACVVAIQPSGVGVSLVEQEQWADVLVEAARLIDDSGRLPDILGPLGFRSAWKEVLEDSHGAEIARIVVLFREPRPYGGIERLALGSLAPVLRATVSLLDQDEELQRARERFASLESSIPGVVYQRRLTPDGDLYYTYISKNAKELFGVDAETILTDPKALFSNYSNAYRDTFRQRLIEASRTLSTWDVEAEILRPDGTIRHTHAIASPRREEDGSTLWTGVILDASRIKEAEQKAAVVEASTRSLIIESLGQPFLFFDADNRLVLKNSFFDARFPRVGALVGSGTSYEDYVRIEGEHDPRLGNGEKRLEARYKGEPLITERTLEDGACLLVDEHRTQDGETVVHYTDITELRRREARIQHMAHHDALTGLPNRVLFNDRLEQAVRRASRSGATVGVLCLDLDHFKNINDTLGHPAGDELLVQISRLIEQQLRGCDTVSRLGGDGFAVVMSDIAGPQQAYTVAERIIETLGAPFDLNGQKALSGGSIGLSYSEEGEIDAGTLLKRADLALYRAKEDGRGVVRIFEEEMDEAARERRTMEMDLRQALDSDGLDLHFQPLIDARTAAITGFEALVRWNHPTRGYISPEEFIPLSEETGLITRVSDYVLEKACREAVAWPKPVRVAVNLSPSQFKQRDMVAKVDAVLTRTGLDPKRLELEITESLLIKNTEAIHQMLYELKALGVRIAMDDFGTGYSSLGNLRSFPFDKLKIDRSFVSELESNPESLAIVRAVVGLGRSMGLETVAEGVETTDQLAYLRIEGCNQVQGYYYSKARPSAEVHTLLTADNPWSACE